MPAQVSGFPPDPRLLRRRVDDYSVLELPVRTANALVKAGIETIGDLLEQTFADILDHRGIGMTGIAWIYEELRRKNLHLKEYVHRTNFVLDEEHHIMRNEDGSLVTTSEVLHLEEMPWFISAYEKTFGHSIPTTTQGDEQ